MYQIVSFIKFFFRSIKLHGVHSPFVFQLDTKCFKDKTNYPEYKQLETYNNILSENKKTITVTDFGQGSRIFKNNTRKIADIAKHAGISKKRQRLLFRMANYLQFKNTLELGTSLGKATVALAINKQNQVTTIEGCQNTAVVAKSTLKEIGITDVSILNDTFEKVLNEPLSFIPDCIYIDGNHNKEDTLNYFHKLLHQVHNDTVLIFDDIYWSKDMTKAWKEIADHPKVTVSIDTFYWGLIFFRKEQEKQSFTIWV